MREQDIKQYLEQARVLKRRIERKHEQIIELQTIAERATSSAEALRSGGTPAHSKIENAVIRILEVKDRLAEDMAAFAEAYKDINRAVESTGTSIYRELLTLRYLEFKTWEEVAEALGRTYHHVTHEMHGKALREIADEKTKKSTLHPPAGAVV